MYPQKTSSRRLLLSVGSLLSLVALISNVQGQTNSPYDVIRIANSQPIIDQGMFDDLGAGQEGANINGPSLIRIPDWISPENRADPSAVYYLYFGHHAGSYIRMAWAENLVGPWHLYQVGSTVPLGNRGVLDNGGSDIDVGNNIVIEEDHLASPDVHVDNENQRIILYFHSGSPTFFNGNEMDGQFTWVATSPYGLDFNNRIEPVKLSVSYVRTFEHANEFYAFDNSSSPKRALDANNPWEPPSNYYAGETIPNLWEARSGELLQDAIKEALGLSRAELRIRHTAVRVEGDELQVFYSRRGDSPERIMMSTVDLSVGDYEDWQLSYPPAELLSATSGWESGQFEPEPSETSTAPEDVNQLRDPYVFEDTNGSLYLIYAGSGEDALGIAAMSSPQQQIEVLTPVEDAYTRGGAFADDNFGSEEGLDLRNGDSARLSRKSYLNFRVANPQDVDAAVLRLYSTRAADISLTLSATDNGWSEDTITWNNAPTEDTELGTLQVGPDDQWYEWDVSAHLASSDDEHISFVLYDDSQGDLFASFSSSEGSNAPELKVLYDSNAVEGINPTPVPVPVPVPSPSPGPENNEDNPPSNEVPQPIVLASGGALNLHFLLLLLTVCIAKQRGQNRHSKKNS